jgi:hypothetical protein
MCIVLRGLVAARDLCGKYASATRLLTFSVRAIFRVHIAANDAIALPVPESYRSPHCTCIALPTLCRYYEPHHGTWRPFDLIASESRRGGYASRVGGSHRRHRSKGGHLQTKLATATTATATALAWSATLVSTTSSSNESKKSIWNDVKALCELWSIVGCGEQRGEGERVEGAVRAALCAREGGFARQADSRRVSAVHLVATLRWGHKQNVLSADSFALVTASHMLTRCNIL